MYEGSWWRRVVSSPASSPQENYNEQRQKREKGRAVGAWSTGTQWLAGLFESARGGNRGRAKEEEVDWMSYASKMKGPWKPKTCDYLKCIRNKKFLLHIIICFRIYLQEWVLYASLHYLVGKYLNCMKMHKMSYSDNGIPPPFYVCMYLLPGRCGLQTKQIGFWGRWWQSPLLYLNCHFKRMWWVSLSTDSQQFFIQTYFNIIHK